MGTAYYMSPEQISGEKVDFRTDLWAFGVMACECLTGRLPFEANTIGGITLKIDQSGPDQHRRWRKSSTVRDHHGSRVRHVERVGQDALVFRGQLHHGPSTIGVPVGSNEREACTHHSWHDDDRESAN